MVSFSLYKAGFLLKKINQIISVTTLVIPHATITGRGKDETQIHMCGRFW